MAEGARIIQFPIAQKTPRTCWKCDWHVEISDSAGLLSSGCDLFDEEIHDERVAETCDGFLDDRLSDD